MRQNCLPRENRTCTHCRQDNKLAYYKEAGNGNDWYWCENCYGLTEWDGMEKKAVEGEAYPNRDKTK